MNYKKNLEFELWFFPKGIMVDFKNFTSMMVFSNGWLVMEFVWHENHKTFIKHSLRSAGPTVTEY